MSRHIKGNFNEKQLCLLPYEYKVDEKSIARVINDLVDTFDMKQLGFKLSETKETGRPPYNPSDLAKLYLYGYFEGIRSSRKLHKETHRNVEVMWLLSGLTPSFRTIAQFRSDNTEALVKLFYHFTRLCNELGLYGKEMVAIDGSKFRANNSKRLNYTKSKIEKQIEYYMTKGKEYIALLEENDTSEDKSESSYTPEEIQEKIKKYQEKLNEFEVLKETVENEGQVSIVDPDARLMGSKTHGTQVAHNVQIAVDAKHHLVTAVDVTSSPADQTELYNMASKSKQVYEEMRTSATDKEEQENTATTMTAIADKGYYSGKELKLCEESGINAIVCPTKKGRRNEFGIEDFKYNKEEDYYVCPAGHKLACISGEKTKDKTYSNRKACKSCELRDQCTKDKRRGKRIIRTEETEYLENAKKRYEENISTYKKRQEIVEHVFGTIKRTLGYDHFLMRGKDKVLAESCMHFMVYNLKRAINILGIEGLRASL